MKKNDHIVYTNSRGESEIHVFGIIIFLAEIVIIISIDSSIVKYNSWLDVCSRLTGLCIPYSYVTSDDYNIIVNKVIEMLE